MTEDSIKKLAEEYGVSLSDMYKIYIRMRPLYQASKLSEVITQFDSKADTDFDVPDVEITKEVSGRYEEIGILGEGGMGSVYRVKDKLLRRVMALKTLKPELQSEKILMQRFVQEACLTAQLEHPGIVPVHDIGTRDDGSLFFTMKEVAGQNLHHLIQSLHIASKDGVWRSFGKGWTFKRVVDAFHRSVEAIAYAHSRDVIHRDLKPDNIMTGSHGEVLVVDWGLAIHLKTQTDNFQKSEIVGTPLYMSPEQMNGTPDALKFTSDTWSLGCILFEILSGHTPFDKQSLIQIKDINPEDADEFCKTVQTKLIANTYGAPKPPIELCELVVKSLHPDPKCRPQNASEFSKALTDWLDGSKRSEAAASIIAQAEDVGLAAQMASEQASSIRIQAKQLAKSIPRWAEDSEKREYWALEELADNLEGQSQQKNIQMEELLHGALTHDPNNTLAHLLLAQRYLQAHQKAEKERDHQLVAFYGSRLLFHTEKIPKQNLAHQNNMIYLGGMGKINLTFEPKTAHIQIIQQFPESRNTSSKQISTLKMSQLIDYNIEMGSYLLVVKMTGYHILKYPVYIDRLRNWLNNRSSRNSNLPIKLLPMNSLQENETHIPQGWCYLGGDELAIDSRGLERVWVDGFIIQSKPVSFKQYLLFLNDLLDKDRTREAELYLPASSSNRRNFSIVENSKRRHYRIHPDPEGDIWDLRWPVFYVDLQCIEAYIKWLFETTGVQWRLPTEQEWEKSARGVDGRYYPWGDNFENSWVCIRSSHRQRPLPEPIASRPSDISIYGVSDMAGGISEWTSTLYSNIKQSKRSVSYVTKGASWNSISPFARLASRSLALANERSNTLGFRLVRDMPSYKE